MNLHAILERHWQQPNWLLRLLLTPLSKLFAKVVQYRRQRYLSGSLNSQKLPVPVVVVGNIHAGGTGKTPITAALVSALQQRGIVVGIISRGYGRDERDIHVLHEHSTAHQAGDEPLMLYRRTHAPTAVGAHRYQAGMALLAQHPNIQIIIADDGLQHYALSRDVEICVFPASDVGRNDLDVLPNGGLRESITRLQTVDFIVNSNADESKRQRAQIHFRLPENTLFISQTHIRVPYRFNRPHETLFSGSLKAHETCCAIAAIARPQRFFDALTQLGFPLSATRALPDHTNIALDTLPDADYVFITEKDAVKLTGSVPDSVWVLPIDAQILPDLAEQVLQKTQICTKDGGL